MEYRTVSVEERIINLCRHVLLGARRISILVIANVERRRKTCHCRSIHSTPFCFLTWGVITLVLALVSSLNSPELWLRCLVATDVQSSYLDIGTNIIHSTLVLIQYTVYGVLSLDP